MHWQITYAPPRNSQEPVPGQQQESSREGGGARKRGAEGVKRMSNASFPGRSKPVRVDIWLEFGQPPSAPSKLRQHPRRVITFQAHLVWGTHASSGRRGDIYVSVGQRGRERGREGEREGKRERERERERERDRERGRENPPRYVAADANQLQKALRAGWCCRVESKQMSQKKLVPPRRP